jgi:hypothetical protein
MKKIFTQEWDLKGNLNSSGISIVNYIQQTIKEHIPEYYEFFPFKIGYSSNSYSKDDFYCLQIKEIVSQMPHIGELKDQQIIDLSKKIFENNPFPSFEESFKVLKNIGFTYDTFTYIGQKDDSKLCWPHIVENVLKWLSHIVAPWVMEMNIKRVKDAIPTPPNFDIQKVLNNIYVIESETGMLQGTAFHLRGIGLITCDHCIREDQSKESLKDLKIYRGNDFSIKKDVSIKSFNSSIDIAILDVDKEFLNDGLEHGITDNLKQMEHIAIAGFPNYNYGDNGIFSPGLIVGFRVYSGIRHILVNTPLIIGNSGGPALNKDNLVIGIAVTGAERMSQAHETEKHGLIPIDAINLIK